MLGKPAISEILHAGQELDNAVDKFAVKLVEDNETFGKHATQTSPLGTTTHLNNSNTLQLSFFNLCLFLDILRSFMNSN